MNANARSKRKQSGSSLIDLGPVLWFLLLGLAFPLLDLACVGIRYTFALAASRDAAQAAGTAKTYRTDLSASDLSAVDAAQAQAATDGASFTGIHIVDIATNLLVTDLTTNTVTRQSVPLSAPADTSSYLYQVEVVLTVDVDPLLTYRDKFFGSVPGLTGPARFVITSLSVCESADGLNQ